MKKFTNYFKLLAVVAAFFSASIGYSQCAANFTWTMGSNGAVTFTSTSTPTTGATSYYWNFGNSTTTIVSAPNNTAATNYPANGIYTVMLFYGTGTCSNSVVYTISINNVTTPTCNLNPSFSTFPGGNGNMSFSNNSTGTVSASTYVWNFGDGSTNSTANSPSHTYTANGTYTVILYANNNFTPSCFSSDTTVINISNVCNLSSSYIYNVGPNGLVSFTSTSSGTTPSTMYQWQGMGTTQASGTNVTQGAFTHTANGSFVFTLTISQGTCSSSSTQIITVTTVPAPTCNINPNFSYTQNNGTVTFNNTSTGTVSGSTYFWQFGGSSATSTLNSPIHTFTANGTYTVALGVTNSTSCANSTVITVFINSICNLNAGFNYTLGSNGSVTFGNTSTGTSNTYYSWNFGDGSSNSSATSPVHTYTTNGSYTVLLTATNSSISPACTDTVAHVITITNSTCTANSGFSLVPSGTPQYWYAIPSSSANVTGAVWSWGDGSTSSGLFSSHTYSAAGNYTICLSVTVTCGASSTTCYTYSIYRSTEDNTIVHIDVKTAEEIALGIENSSVKDMAYTVSPNPNNGTFRVNINGLSAKAKVDVYNIIGELVYTSENETANGSLVKDINLERASKGVYFVKVSSDNKVYTKKLVINK